QPFSLSSQCRRHQLKSTHTRRVSLRHSTQLNMCSKLIKRALVRFESGISGIYSRRGSCKVCNDLDGTTFDDSRVTNATPNELESAVERRCPSCFLISSAISTFFVSLPIEFSEIYNPRQLLKFSLWLGDHTSLILGLHFP